MLQNMNRVDKDNGVSVCANCGKEGYEINDRCNKCNQVVKYCNAACKKKNQSQHKKECRKRAAEIHDEELFKQPPPNEDCTICFQLLPSLITGSKYQSCCGKVICSGCIHAPVYDNQGNEVDNKKCPFCRTPRPESAAETNERREKRIEANDPIAIDNQGCWYKYGKYGYPIDHKKALELHHRAGELGHAKAYTNIGACYDNGQGVEADKKKAIHYFELAAMDGCIISRHNLGINEGKAGNLDRALKHFIIAVKDGHNESLQNIKQLYSNGFVPKEDYMKALQSYQEYLGEIKSVQRDKAAASDERFRYY